jgi:hypothetical protein
LPTLRAIDWLNAARCVKTNGERRAAMARMEDMVMRRFVVVFGCEVYGVECLWGTGLLSFGARSGGVIENMQSAVRN